MHARSYRGLLLLPAAAFVVHQARYMLAYGSGASAELSAQGHAYLGSLVPWFVFALGIGLALFLRRVVRGDLRTARVSAPGVWLLAWAGLLGIYVVQESLEATLVSGHPGGVGGVFGHGGWWAVPVSAIVALAVTALLRVARAVLRFASRLQPRALRGPAAVFQPASVVLAVPAPLAYARASRGPPLRYRPR
jgi:hypothetical protein